MHQGLQQQQQQQGALRVKQTPPWLMQAMEVAMAQQQQQQQQQQQERQQKQGLCQLQWNKQQQVAGQKMPSKVQHNQQQMGLRVYRRCRIQGFQMQLCSRAQAAAACQRQPRQLKRQ
jgi:hypothetical protein